MKKESEPIKVRARNGTEIFYTFKHWPLKDIDGIKFVSVVKTIPSSYKTQTMHWMRKDTLEYIK